MKNSMLYSEEQNKGRTQVIFPTPTNPVVMNTIREGMSPEEIANVISDRLVSIAGKVFQAKGAENEGASPALGAELLSH